MSPTVRRDVAFVMGMPVSLALRGRHADDAVGRAAWAEALADLHDADRTFSTYLEDSVVSRVNAGTLALDDAPAALHEVIAIGAAAEQASGGAFSVWRPGGGGSRLLDTDGGSRLLDTDGVVKGWAVERAARHLVALDDTDVCLSAGGDMVCHTADRDGEPWRIGVEDPHDVTRCVAVVDVRRGAVATSGSARRGEHVQDRRDGSSASGLASVTVVADSLTDADVDATAAFALGVDGTAWLAARPGRWGLVVRDDGHLVTTARTGVPLRWAELTRDAS